MAYSGQSPGVAHDQAARNATLPDQVVDKEEHPACATGVQRPGPDLAELVALWAEIPEAVRKSLLTMARAASGNR
jgi:hypothetical protein